MIKVVGHADHIAFERFGREAATIIRDTVAATGRHMATMNAILDFGCGCGRVARHWPDLGAPTQLHGCDYNGNAVAWCRDKLPFLQARTNALAPPLPYEDEQFDLIYALSVFTHLDERMHVLWIAELRRVVKRGGLIFFTIKGGQHAQNELDAESMRLYSSGRFVVTEGAVQGTNLCAAYANHEWVSANMLDGFTLVTHCNHGYAMMGGQDTYLVRRV